MTSPAERFAAAHRRQAAVGSLLHRFREALAYPLDDFQVRACQALEQGRGVLVAAPTGAGKTVVGEFGVHLAVRTGRKAFYTTPIKALSNQKYADLVAIHGSDRVGLLTGDVTVNGEAPVVVMTTEVLRNMLYAGSPTLNGLGCVVMDEVHYLADRFRGAVWEEVIIHLPREVQLVSLSATVSNAEEFGAWLDMVHGDTEVVVEEHRPVPLYQHVLLGSDLHDLFVDDDRTDATIVNPELIERARRDRREVQMQGSDGRGDHRGRRGRHGHRGSGSSARSGPRARSGSSPGSGARSGSGRGPSSFTGPSRAEVVSRLDAAGMLPAITFIFSRAGCDAAVRQCLRAGLRLTTPAQAQEIREYAEARTQDVPTEDLDVLGYWEWLDGLSRGLAAHHAGMLPSFKEVVEHLFVRGLVRCVFATETLALGINMPARTVVLERLVKWNGQSRVAITPGEYTQLTGRAGRRGIDLEGHAVVLWERGMDPESVAGLASARTYPLRSSFRPTYNMAVNLVDRVGRHRAREVLETSFAQFQADRAVVGTATQLRGYQEALDGYQEAMACHLGDFTDYAAMRRSIGDLESASAKNRRAERNAAASEGSRPQRSRRGGSGTPDAEEIHRLRARLRAHPCHACPEREDHARWAERWWQLQRDAEKLERRIQGRTSVVARTFDRVCEVLVELGYLSVAEHPTDDSTITLPPGGPRTQDCVTTVTATGQQLRRLYTEFDLLTAECLRARVWSGLDGPALAACVSALVHESRRDEAAAPRLPGPTVTEALDQMARICADLQDREASHGLSTVRPIDVGLAWPMHRWARGNGLEIVLGDGELAAGDFVRRCKQLVDLLDQIAVATNDPRLRTSARQAIDGVLRGVVAHTISS